MFFFFFDEKSIQTNINYKREKFEEFYETLQKTNLSITGLRQVGKTTIAKQLMQKYIKDNHLKLEDSAIINLKALSNVTKQDIIKNISESDYKLIFIDEIQLIEDWTNMVQVLCDDNPDTKFIFSGSSASALGKEIALGRVKNLYLNPLTYKEFIDIWNLEDFDQYLKYGSFPKGRNGYNLENHYREIANGTVINGVINEDITKRIDKSKFNRFFRNIKNYIGNEIPLTRLDSESNIKPETRKEYINIAYDARLIRFVVKYNDNNKKTKNKVYYNDKSLMFLMNNFNKLNDNEYGSLIENLIFNYLDDNLNKSPGFNKIQYYRDSKGREVDFVLEENNLLIESKYSTDKNQIASEIDKLIETISKEKFETYNKLIITKNISLKYRGWIAIPLIEFINNLKKYL